MSFLRLRKYFKMREKQLFIHSLETLANVSLCNDVFVIAHHCMFCLSECIVLMSLKTTLWIMFSRYSCISPTITLSLSGNVFGHTINFQFSTLELQL